MAATVGFPSPSVSPLFSAADRHDMEVQEVALSFVRESYLQSTLNMHGEKKKAWRNQVFVSSMRLGLLSEKDGRIIKSG